MNNMFAKLFSLTLISVLLAASAWAKAPAPGTPPATPPPAGATPPPAAPAPAAPVMITDQDIKGIAAPAADARGKGDPDGALTGTVADVVVADPVTDKTPK